MSRLLALDQSSHITGYAIFENGKLLHCNKFIVNEDQIGKRLMSIKSQVQAIINEYDITEVVLEDIQMQGNVVNNVQTFKILAQVIGVIVELLTELRIPYTEVLASSWKSTLGIKGRGRTEQKQNAQKWVFEKYNIKPIQDICDAICIGSHYLTKKPIDEGFDWSD